MLLVTDRAGSLQGVVTKTDIFRAVRMASDGAGYR
jgi:predicted transcriptional regulator